LKIAFIGGGNMGEAMLAAVLARKLATVSDTCVSDVSEACRAHLKKRYGVAVTAASTEAVKDRDIIILAVKPQQMPDVMAALRGKLKSTQLVLSIAAGVTIASLRDGLGHRCLARAMPNTPARIGLGMSGWVATPEVSATQKEQVRGILGAMGREIAFDDEKYLDMITAVSGSGPAYLFLFAEALTEAAVNIGLSPAEAEILVSQTLFGAASLMRESGETPAALRRAVTSKGGTTERALEALDEGGFKELVSRAVAAAYKRAQELGK
jgi:pyrroline-5-carboxylate reductase